MFGNKTSVPVLMLLLCLACTEAERKERPDLLFPVTTSLTTERQQAPSDDVYMRYPYRIRLVDSLLYVMDLHAIEAYCHQFSYPDFKYIRSFAYRGNTSGFFLSADNIRMNAKGDLSILDSNQNLIAHIDTETGDITDEIKLPTPLIRTLDFAPLNDTTYIVPDYTGEHRFAILGSNGEIVKQVSRIPKGKKEKSTGVTLSQAWRAFIDYNQSNDVLAMATQFGQVLEIYHTKTDSLVNVVIGGCGRPKYVDRGGYAAPNGIMGYGDIQVGEQYIYVLFWGTSFDEIRKGDRKIEGGNILEIFDLEGNPVRRYELDRYISGFQVLENEGRILALDVNSDQPIVIYKL